MILTKEINIKINRGNIGIYRKINKNFNINDKIKILPEQLSKNSSERILAKCDICGKELETNYMNYTRNFEKHQLYTCKKCSNEKCKKTSLELYGVDNPSKSVEIKEKIKNIFLEKYGVENPQNLDIIKNKTKQTNLEKYECEYTLQNKNVKEKSKETLLKKYGVDNYSKNENWLNQVIKTSNKKYGVDFYSQTDESRNKAIETNLEKYGVEHPRQLEENRNKIKVYIKEYNDEKLKKFIEKYNILKVEDDICICYCDKCYNNFEISKSLLKNRYRINTTLCLICNPTGSRLSGLEIQLYDFIKENYDGEILRNKRIILDNEYELDIYIPELKLAFEFNGIYWHNELYKNNNYHKEKSDLCEKKGIQLIHIWQDDWLYKQEIIKSIILNKLRKNNHKIYARKCLIKEIDSKISNNFLKYNHIQGKNNGKINIGLYYDDELVSLMTFGKKRLFMKSSSKEGEYELLRFCNKINTSVIGGASKLFHYFIKNYKPKQIITYADRSYSNGNLYKQLGFEFIHKTEPNYYYVIDGIRKHRFGFRKDVLVKEGFDTSKTEHEIMIDREIYRIYNAGNLKYEYIN